MEDKRVLVIGASGLLGRAIAQAFMDAGVTVAGTYFRNPDFCVGDDQYRFDIRSPATIQELADKLECDGIAVTSGINIPGTLQDTTSDDWFTVIDENLLSLMLIGKYLVPKINDNGFFIALGSVSAHLGGPTSGHYAAAKAGAVALVQNLALVHARRGVRCNVVSPGYIASPMAEAGARSETVRATIERIPMGRLGTPEDVAGAVLAVAEMEYVTGQEIHVNGGLYFG